MDKTIFYSLLLALFWSSTATSQELTNVAWADTYRGSLQLCRHPQSGLFGIKRKDGTLLLPPEYREIRYVQHPCDEEGYFIFAQNDAKRKNNGAAMPPMPFRAYLSQGQPARGSVFLWSDFYNYGFLRDDEESLPTACIYKDIRFICDAPNSPIIWLLSNNQKTQIAHLDANREKVVFDKSQWDAVHNFQQGLWALYKKNKIQLATLDYKQKWKPLLSDEFREVQCTDDGRYILLQAYKNKKWGCYAYQEGFLIPVLDMVYDSLQYLGQIPQPQILAKQRKGWGLIQLEKKPRTLVPLQYRHIQRLGAYTFASQKDSTDIWDGDKLIRSFPFQGLGGSPSAGLQLVVARKKWGLLNTQRLQIVCPLDYDSITVAVSAKFLYLYQGGAQGLYSISQENALLLPQYDSIKPMGGANWAVYTANKMGYFESEQGRQLVPPIFEQITALKSGISESVIFLVVQNGLYGLYGNGQLLPCAYQAPKITADYMFFGGADAPAALWDSKLGDKSSAFIGEQPLDSFLRLRWRRVLPAGASPTAILAYQKRVFLPSGWEVLHYNQAGDSLPTLKPNLKSFGGDSLRWVAPSSQSDMYFLAWRGNIFCAWDAKRNKVIWERQTPVNIEFEPVYKDINKDKLLDICDGGGAWAINGKNGQLLAALGGEKKQRLSFPSLDFMGKRGEVFELGGAVAVFGLGDYLWLGEGGGIKAFYRLPSGIKGPYLCLDVDGDGRKELLWVGEDGYIYCYGEG